jgi:hypothetical protein
MQLTLRLIASLRVEPLLGLMVRFVSLFRQLQFLLPWDVLTDWGVSVLVAMKRFPHFLDSRLIDGGKVVSVMRRPPFTLRNIPGTHFC